MTLEEELRKLRSDVRALDNLLYRAQDDIEWLEQENQDMRERLQIIEELMFAARAQR